MWRLFLQRFCSWERVEVAYVVIQVVQVVREAIRRKQNATIAEAAERSTVNGAHGAEERATLMITILTML